VHAEEEVARLASLHTSVALADETNVGAVVHARWDLDLNFSVARDDALALARAARVRDDGALASALSALRGDRDEAVCDLLLQTNRQLANPVCCVSCAVA
jgi:hypothetical protein